MPGARAVREWLDYMGWQPAITTNPEGTIQYAVSKGFHPDEARQAVYGAQLKYYRLGGQPPPLASLLSRQGFGGSGRNRQDRLPMFSSPSVFSMDRGHHDTIGHRPAGPGIPSHPQGNLQQYPAGSLEAMTQAAFPQGYDPTSYEPDTPRAPTPAPQPLFNPVDHNQWWQEWDEQKRRWWDELDRQYWQNWERQHREIQEQ